MELKNVDTEELLGLMIDTIEDWLESKGIDPEVIPNEERLPFSEVFILGSDYDHLADSFAKILGIERENNIDIEKE